MTVPARASKHAAGCLCQRCTGFLPNNERGLVHGAYSRLQLTPAAAETADVLRQLVPLNADTDEAAIQIAAFTIEQLRCAAQALEDPAQRTERLRLSQDAQGCVGRFLKCIDVLGMSPQSRLRLGLDLVAIARRRNVAELDTSLLPEDEQRVLREAEAILAREGAL